MMHTWLPVCLCLLILSSHMTQAAITCTAVTTIYETTVRCDFGTDIFQRKDNFNVQHYKPEDPNDPDTMLLCNWLGSGALDCKKGKDVTFNNVVSDTLTVKGPPSPNKIGDHYVCQLEAKADIPVQPCKLTFTQATTTTTATMPANVIPDERTDILWIILALTGVAVVGIFGFCIVYIIFNRHRARQSWHDWTSVHKKTCEKSQQTDEEVTVPQIYPGLPKDTEGSTECSGAEGSSTSNNTEPENKKPSVPKRIWNFISGKKKNSNEIALNTVVTAQPSQDQSQDHRIEKRGHAAVSTSATASEQQRLMTYTA